MAKMTWIDQTAGALLIAGGLNWGSIAFFSKNLVQSLVPAYSNLVYMLVGASALWMAYRGYVQKFN